MLPRAVLAAHLRLSVGLRPQEVAGRRRRATCQSPVNHLPLSLALRGEDDEEEREVLDYVDEPLGGHVILDVRAQEVQQIRGYAN